VSGGRPAARAEVTTICLMFSSTSNLLLIIPIVADPIPLPMITLEDGTCSQVQE